VNNIEVIYRLYPCRALVAGGSSAECIPAPDIINPVAIGSPARAQQVAEASLHNPGSEASAHDWHTAGIVTTGNRYYQEGGTFKVRLPDSSEAVGVLGEPLLSHDGKTLSQQLVVHYLPPQL
jgi:hypothetical protein